MLIVLALLGSLNAHATTYTEIYSCSNPAQTADAPAVSIVMDENRQQYVLSESMGVIKKYTSISPANDFLVDGAHYTGKNFDVYEQNGVEDPPARATVKYFGLVYKCSPTGLK